MKIFKFFVIGLSAAFTPNDNMFEVTKFIAEKSSNMYNDSLLEVYENTHSKTINGKQNS